MKSGKPEESQKTPTQPCKVSKQTNIIFNAGVLGVMLSWVLWMAFLVMEPLPKFWDALGVFALGCAGITILAFMIGCAELESYKKKYGEDV